MIAQLIRAIMTQDWRKRLDWMDKDDFVEILTDLGILCEGRDEENLRELLTELIEAEPQLRLKLPHMHVDDN